MTVVTKLPYDKEYIDQFSKDKNEPEWMRAFRLDALEQAESLNMPEPDKTKIGRWNFSKFKHTAAGEAVTALKDLPSEMQEFFDEDKQPENLLVQRNHSVAYASLS